MSNRYEEVLPLISDAIQDLELSQQSAAEAQATGNPETRLSKLLSAIAWHEETITILRRAKQIYNDGILITLGAEPQIYVNIYGFPNETLEYLESMTPVFSADNAYNGATINATITGRYKARDNNGNFRFWYRIEYQTAQVGWISDSGINYLRNDPRYTDALVQDNLDLLREKDRDGTLVYTFYYNSPNALLSYAPLDGNIAITPVFFGTILRAFAFARNSAYLGSTNRFFHVRFHYSTGSTWYSLDGWIDESRLISPL